MTSIELTSITGSITIPYQIFACDVYGNNCILIATISTTVPPSNNIILPSQFDTAPAVGIKVITFDGCERFETFYCNEFLPSPTPSLTPTQTITPTITPTISLTPTITPTISLTPTITPTISLTPTNTITPTKTPTPTPTPPTPFARFNSSGSVYAINSYTSFNIPSGVISLSGVPFDVLTIQINWPATNTMTGTTTLNSNSLTEGVTSTFTVPLNSLGTADITGVTTRVGPTVYGQKLFRLTILSSSGSYPISPTQFNFNYGIKSSPPGSAGNYIGNNSVSSANNTLSCSNILSQSTYITNGFSIAIGQYLYDNSGSVLINGGNNWVSLWPGLFDYLSPTSKVSVQVDPTGLILNVLPC